LLWEFETPVTERGFSHLLAVSAICIGVCRFNFEEQASNTISTLLRATP
jgi:hypothetical protein